MIPWLVLSSCSFLLPIYFSLQAGVYETTYVYVFLLITSLLWHSTNLDIFWFIDLFAVSLAVWRGYVDGYNTRPLGLLLGFVGSILYISLFAHARFMNKHIPVFYHMGIHILTSIGVSIQMLLYKDDQQPSKKRQQDRSSSDAM